MLNSDRLLIHGPLTGSPVAPLLMTLSDRLDMENKMTGGSG